MYLGGLSFPIEGLSSWLQTIARVTPLCSILDVIRGIIVGVSPADALPAGRSLGPLWHDHHAPASTRFEKRLS